MSKNSWDTSRVDFCCPDNKKVKHEPSKVKSSIERIPCDITEGDFINSYVRKEIPVILVNCSDTWAASSSWTFDKFLTANDGHEKWRTDYKYAHKSGKNEHISGRKISDILLRNGTFRIFEILGRGRAKTDTKNFYEYKTKMMQEYARPKPIPEGIPVFLY